MQHKARDTDRRPATKPMPVRLVVLSVLATAPENSGDDELGDAWLASVDDGRRPRRSRRSKATCAPIRRVPAAFLNFLSWQTPDNRLAPRPPVRDHLSSVTNGSTSPAMAMAESASAAAPDRRHHRRALSDIQFASVVDPDLTPSEDEGPEEKTLQLEDAQSAIGVSIGHQQTRLTSPKTPAAEKAAALDDVEGGGLFETWQQTGDGTIEQKTAQAEQTSGLSDDNDSNDNEEQPRARDATQSPTESTVRLPSPWRATPKKIQVDDHRSALRDSFAAGYRRRALSGGDTLRKYIPFNLPSIPKSSLLSFSLPSFSVSSFDSAKGRPTGNMAPRKRVVAPITPHDGAEMSKEDVHPAPPHRRNVSDPEHQNNTNHNYEGPVVAPTDSPRPSLHRRPAPKLRRSNSEGSLLLYRQRSFASSLGDDSRFENVSEMVNSRFKAIKDSWQDSSFKLPSFTTLPNFSFGSRDDLFRLNRPSGASTPRVPEGSRPRPLAGSFPVGKVVLPSKLNRAKDSSTSIAGMSAANAMAHPHFAKAVQELTGDVVVLGGYRGSILRSAEPPNRQLWVPIKVGLNLRKVDLELGLNPEDEETEEERIIPGGMLTHIGPVDIAKRLFKRLRASDNAKNGTLRVHNYGYDWRLSPHILSRRLIDYLETLPCNQPGVPPEKRGAIMISHSLGGLITRHAVNHRPELFAGVVYAGVPQTCVNILGPLRNGDDVLLSSRVLTAQVNFTIRTSFALLPLDGKCFINKYTKEEYPVDFFDVKTWVDHALSPCVATPVPAPGQIPNTGLTGMLSAMSQALPSFPMIGRKGSMSKGSPSTIANTNNPSTSNLPSSANPSTSALTSVTEATHAAADKLTTGTSAPSGVTPQMGSNTHPTLDSLTSTASPSTTVTLPHSACLAYLSRTLSSIKTWKLELAHQPALTATNRYPPLALIYGKSTPTVYGAKVESREAIKRTDAYDELAFASGDGVVLARAAMVPEGYSVVRGGVVSSDRGHVTLLGDLEAVGRCLSAVVKARKSGVGLGLGIGEESASGDGGPVGGQGGGRQGNGGDKVKGKEIV
ncbi:hypothetical protein BCR34DRAFT_584361 [Clohesyomyces aquaticus]|uniref:Uncharacterized protein n=1 Tax=Clohesyomyces aquaticus TaxID=1231657 RepID=A0A1Y2A1K3_9PLEO|nr:hypothetical protein BCR34DRAFT_584361 [Clohesyomyces aquaticus]